MSVADNILSVEILQLLMDDKTQHVQGSGLAANVSWKSFSSSCGAVDAHKSFRNSSRAIDGAVCQLAINN